MKKKQVRVYVFLADIFCHNQNLAQGKKIQCLDFQKDLLFFQHCSKF